MNRDLKILFIFVDGLGIGRDDPAENPLCEARFPQLEKMVKEAIPLDACLGVDGLPQSATGQASLLTGVNAAEAMGRHIEGFPPPRLKELIQRENIFSELRKLGARKYLFRAPKTRQAMHLCQCLLDRQCRTHSTAQRIRHNRHDPLRTRKRARKR